MRFDSEPVDENRVCPGIHKVRVGPATSSVLATSYTTGKGKVVRNTM